MAAIEIVVWRSHHGVAPFEDWFRKLARSAPVDARRVVEGLDRLRDGNTSALKALGRGLFEVRFHFGPGHRVYCARDGDVLVVLLAAGDKATQDRDIARARVFLAEWRNEKET